MRTRCPARVRALCAVLSLACACSIFASAQGTQRQAGSRDGTGMEPAEHSGKTQPELAAAVQAVPPRPQPRPPQARRANGHTPSPPPAPLPPPPLPPKPSPPLPSDKQVLRADHAPTIYKIDVFAGFASKLDARNALYEALNISMNGSRSIGVKATGLTVPTSLTGVAASTPAISSKQMDVLWTQWVVRYRYRYTPAEKKKAWPDFVKRVNRIWTKLHDLIKPDWAKFGPCLAPTRNCNRVGKSFFAPTPRRRAAGSAIIADTQAEPAAWNWRDMGKVTPARQQGECAAFWVYAAVGAIESAALIDGGTVANRNPIDLSEQQILDCATPEAGYNSFGCEGSTSLTDAFLFASNSTGGSLLSEEAYNAGDQCKPASSADSVQLDGSGFVPVAPRSKTALQQALLKGPVLVGFFATLEFGFYSGGTWKADQCLPPTGPLDGPGYELNHALLVVGYNFTATPPVWVVKNSWGGGGDWGDDGFAFIEATEDNTWGACGMYAWVLQPALLVKRAAAVIRRTFSSAQYNSLPVSTCRGPRGDCGVPAALAWCRLQGFESLEEVGPYQFVLQAAYPGRSDMCTGACESFSSLTCGTQETIRVRFNKPQDFGLPLDVCMYSTSTNCGLEVAQTWCNDNGFAFVYEQATDTEASPNGQTAYSSGLYVCNGLPGYCRAVPYIICSSEETGQKIFYSPKVEGLPIDTCAVRGDGKRTCLSAAMPWCKMQGYLWVLARGMTLSAPRTRYIMQQSDICIPSEWQVFPIIFPGPCPTFTHLICGRLEPDMQRFDLPEWQGLPVSGCIDTPSIGCGKPAADAWCVIQNFRRAAQLGPVDLVPKAIFPRPNMPTRTCDVGNCITFSFIVCE